MCWTKKMKLGSEEPSASSSSKTMMARLSVSRYPLIVYHQRETWTKCFMSFCKIRSRTTLARNFTSSIWEIRRWRLQSRRLLISRRINLMLRWSCLWLLGLKQCSRLGQWPGHQALWKVTPRQFYKLPSALMVRDSHQHLVTPQWDCGTCRLRVQTLLVRATRVGCFLCSSVPMARHWQVEEWTITFFCGMQWQESRLDSPLKVIKSLSHL